MPSREAAVSQSAAAGQGPDGPDLIGLLQEDHQKVAGLFGEFDRASEARKPEVADQICAELTIHAILEEEIFYPEARQCLDNDAGEDLLDQAEVEHESIKGLVDRIKQSGGNSDLFEARVAVLKEYVEHHVREEEAEMFPRLRQAQFVSGDVGIRLQERKKELMGK